MDHLDRLAEAEYAALRATIRERGTLRLGAILVTVAVWAALVVVTPLRGPSSLAFLLVLAAGFEVTFACHIGVDRIGRYVQHRYESAGRAGPAWERLAMSATFPRIPGLDPLAANLFLAAGLANLAVSLPGSGMADHPVFSLVLVLAHVVFAGRVVTARRIAARQRAADLDALVRAGDKDH
jgi:hypothetical protein